VNALNEEELILGMVAKFRGQEIKGPLGIWSFPILNRIRSAFRSKKTIYEIVRDEMGRIKEIHVIEVG